MSLFASRQTIQILLPENGPNAAINEQLATLVSLLHSDLLLIVRGNKLTKAQENAAWFTQLAAHAVLVTCQTPEQAHLPKWVAARAKQHNLQLDDAANQLLCYCYEGNLLALAQALDRLSLLWPDGKLTLPRVEQAVNDAAHFTPFHWVDALLSAKSKRALHILQQLRLEGSEPVILLRTLQRELLLLITLKRQSAHTPLRSLFDKHRVWQNRRALTTEAVNRLSHEQLRQAVQLLMRAELTLKQDYGQSVWAELESLSCCSATRRWQTFLLMDSMHSLQALYGGTFDPVHYGHLKPVEILANQIGLQRVTIMPNNVPPHRPQPEATSEQRKRCWRWPSRINRCFRLMSGNCVATPLLDVANAAGVARRTRARPAAGVYHWPGFSAQFPHWHKYETILENSHLLVCRRPGYPLTMREEQYQQWLEDHLTDNVEDLHNQPAGKIYLAETPWFDISATLIRERLQQGLACDDLLPTAVLAYIHTHGLYQKSADE
jgi:DNA polymerase-3 subunit delta